MTLILCFIVRFNVQNIQFLFSGKGSQANVLFTKQQYQDKDQRFDIHTEPILIFLSNSYVRHLENTVFYKKWLEHKSEVLKPPKKSWCWLHFKNAPGFFSGAQNGGQTIQ